MVKMVRKMDRANILMVNTRYLPSRGTTRDVGGIMSRKGRKNSVNASKIEMHRVIFSPDLVDKLNTTIVRKPKLRHGMIRLIV
jgi:hypothetical protein